MGRRSRQRAALADSRIQTTQQGQPACTPAIRIWKQVVPLRRLAQKRHERLVHAASLLRRLTNARPRRFLRPPWKAAGPLPPRFEEFRLERRLGSGASGDVWLARDTLLERAVAVKVASEAVDDEVRARFRIEARAVARLQHPNVLAVHHAGEIDAHPYVVTELLSGKSLDALDLPLDSARVIGIGIDLARGLFAAHCAGVIHRDIKPANAFLGDDGVAKLIDFGLARLYESPTELAATAHAVNGADGAESSSAMGSTQAGHTLSGRIAGSPLYMAPETWRGEAPTRRTDIYSLGALLFQLLSGHPPVPAKSIAELRPKVLAGAIEDLGWLAPEAPAPLVELVNRCLSVNPNHRPTADELCDALQRLVQPATDDAPDDPSTNPYRGLLPFGAENRALFFGREAEAAAVISELRAHPFVLVVGESGAGKSSLVRAGVVPRVEAGAIDAGVSRRALAMTPGLRPSEMLAEIVAPVTDLSAEELLRRQAESASWLTGALSTKDLRVLLVVDQLEELWCVAGARERASFLATLTTLVQAGGVRIVATLRADFLDRLEDLGELQGEALAAPIVLGPLTPAGLRRAIAEPARRRGVTLDPALVEQLAAEGGRGTLPLLGFALAAVWDRREPGARSLGLDALTELGGVSGALAAHADGTLARMPPSERSEARRLMLDLVTVERTRVRREERDLLRAGADGSRRALEALVAARLVVVSAGEHGAAYEVAHEALLREWPALRGWLDEEATAREALERLGIAAAEWERLGRAEESLFGERQLRELDALALGPVDPASRSAPETASAAFVGASRAAIQRARHRGQILAFGIPLALVLVGVLAWTVTYARHRAAALRALATARTLDASAEAVARATDEARAGAFALFEKDDSRTRGGRVEADARDGVRHRLPAARRRCGARRSARAGSG